MSWNKDELFVKVGVRLNKDPSLIQEQLNKIGSKVDITINSIKIKNEEINKIKSQIENVLQGIQIKGLSIDNGNEVSRELKLENNILKERIAVINNNIKANQKLQETYKNGELARRSVTTYNGKYSTQVDTVKNTKNGEVEEKTTILDNNKYLEDTLKVRKEINDQCDEYIRKIQKANLVNKSGLSDEEYKNKLLEEQTKLTSEYNDIKSKISQIGQDSIDENTKESLEKQLALLKSINEDTKKQISFKESINKTLETQKYNEENSLLTEKEKISFAKRYADALSDPTESLNLQKAKISEIASEENKRINLLDTIKTEEKLISDRIAASNLKEKDKIRYKEKLKKLSEDISKAEQNGGSNTYLKQQLTNLESVNKSISTTERNTKSFKDKFETAFAKFGQWLGVAAIYAQASKAIKDMTQNVIKLDTALTELRKVTDLTESGLKDVTIQAYNLGQQVGRTGIEVINAMSVWARAGKDVPTAEYLAKYTLMFTNIADGINDVTEASSALISIMSGFNMDDSSIEHIIDVLNEINQRKSPIMVTL